MAIYRSDAETVEPRRCSMEQVGFLARARPLRQPLAGVPEHAVAVGALVHREIAFEHRAGRAERGDAGLDVAPPRRGQLLAGRRQLAFVDVEAGHPHAKSTE